MFLWFILVKQDFYFTIELILSLQCFLLIFFYNISIKHDKIYKITNNLNLKLSFYSKN